MPAIKNLPPQLRNLVHETVTLLGDVIKEHCGEIFFNQIESLRELMIRYRQESKINKEKILNEVHQQLLKTTHTNRKNIAHGFTLMLELINSCENAYRTHKLRQNQNKKLNK